MRIKTLRWVFETESPGQLFPRFRKGLPLRSPEIRATRLRTSQNFVGFKGLRLSRSQKTRTVLSRKFQQTPSGIWQAQSLRASVPGMCLAERHRFEAPANPCPIYLALYEFALLFCLVVLRTDHGDGQSKEKWEPSYFLYERREVSKKLKNKTCCTVKLT